jgi:hypothetical protein
MNTLQILIPKIKIELKSTCHLYEYGPRLPHEKDLDNLHTQKQPLKDLVRAVETKKTATSSATGN